jgi:glutamate synthase (ferredoxin)
MLSGEVAKRYGHQGLPDGTIHVRFTGTAGQSFGAWTAQGVTLDLVGEGNDYVGKGLSGGTIAVFPPRGSTFVAEENVIVGNVALYGATAGEAFIRGVAGERFAVRNSGASAVVEGVGDHGCEYMTGGRVVVLGKTGRNFAAGMSGGVAWVLDDGGFAKVCNPELVSVEKLTDPAEIAEVKALVERHAELTGSKRAQALLADWSGTVARFARVIPNDYRRVLEAQARMRQKGMSPAEAEMAAFEENAHDAMRVGGT